MNRLNNIAALIIAIPLAIIAVCILFLTVPLLAASLGTIKLAKWVLE